MLAVLPLLIVTGVVTWIGVKEVKRISDEQITLFEEKLLKSKEKALKEYIDIALSAIAPTLNDKKLNEHSAQGQVKKIIDGLNYGKDGYYFVYDSQGVSLVHPIQRHLVGKNLYPPDDEQGDQTIKELLRIAAVGGGFHQYSWNRPSTNINEKKIAYVVKLPRWDWVLGSGLYLEDIANEVATLRQLVDKNIQKNITAILLILVVTTLLIISLMLFINIQEGRLADRRLRGLAKNFVSLQIKERRHFSRELHDGINQLMVAVKFRMELGISQINKETEATKLLDNLKLGLTTINETIQEVRRISHALRPGLLDEMGLEAALNNLLDQFQERTGISLQRKFSLGATKSLPDDVEITAYRVVQEALTNAERHAQATQFTLRLVQTSAHLKLHLQDNGRGFSAEANQNHGDTGMGLTNMRERVELLGGEFQIQSTVGLGTYMCVTLPYNPQVI